MQQDTKPEGYQLPDFLHVLCAAEAGDPSSIPLLRDLLDKHPCLWRKAGDLTRHVEDLLLGMIAGQSLFTREAALRHLKVMRADLSESSPSPLEKLLIDRVCVCWLQVHAADIAGVNMTNFDTLRRQNASQTRYLAAIRQLAVVRRLLRPAPSALDLLKVPVSETRTDSRQKLRGGSRLKAEDAEDPRLEGVRVDN
jgi:hypothetical protein